MDFSNCPKRFIDICCFVIAVAHRCSYSSPLLSSLRSELESNALSLSLSPLCNHLLSHPTSLDLTRLFPSVEPGSTPSLWLSVEQHVENGHYSEAVAVLLQLLQSAEHQSLFILYDLILLAMKHNTETILPLQRLLLTQLISSNRSPFSSTCFASSMDSFLHYKLEVLFSAANGIGNTHNRSRRLFINRTTIENGAFGSVFSDSRLSSSPIRQRRFPLFRKRIRSISHVD